MYGIQGNLPKTHKRRDLLMILLDLNIQYSCDFILGLLTVSICVNKSCSSKRTLKKSQEMTCSLEIPGWNLDQDTKYLQNFCGFPQSLQTNYWKVSPIGIRSLPFTSFLFLYSLVFLLFDLIQFVKKRLQTLRKVCSTHLNKQQSDSQYAS
jgi:hypothetical protein